MKMKDFGLGRSCDLKKKSQSEGCKFVMETKSKKNPTELFFPSNKTSPKFLSKQRGLKKNIFPKILPNK
jgi:hypothetical protein